MHAALVLLKWVTWYVTRYVGVASSSCMVSWLRSALGPSTTIDPVLILSISMCFHIVGSAGISSDHPVIWLLLSLFEVLNWAISILLVHFFTITLTTTVNSAYVYGSFYFIQKVYKCKETWGKARMMFSPEPFQCLYYAIWAAII